MCDFYRCSAADYVRPLVEKLARRFGLAGNALWRLVADAIAARFLDAGRRFRCLEDARESAMTILRAGWIAAMQSPASFLRSDPAPRDEQQRKLLSLKFRARGGCCRYYTVEDGELCETCVLKKPEERKAELLRAMRRRYESDLQRGGLAIMQKAVGHAEPLQKSNPIADSSWATRYWNGSRHQAATVNRVTKTRVNMIF